MIGVGKNSTHNYNVGKKKKKKRILNSKLLDIE